MDLRQLLALVAVADHGSFSRAARSLHTVQSNVSAHIANLERHLGAHLVDRQTGTLTAEGLVVLARARRIRSELDALQADVASLGEEVRGTVRVGIIGSTARWLAPSMLQRLQADHPKVRTVLVEGSTTALAPLLLAGRLDIAVVNLPVDDSELAVDALFGEDRVLVAPEAHPLAEHDSVTVDELAHYPLLLGAPGTALREELDQGAAAAGVTLEAQAEIDGVRLMASLAFQGFGPAILPATAVPSWLTGAWRRVTVIGLPQRLVGLARRRRELLSTPAQVLMTVIRTVIGEQGADQPGVHLLEGGDRIDRDA